ncbi:MFS transporter [Pseudonocardia benzenivorans]|jgi:MFS family permease|uniref:General substrate transporter n=2 Tax=Pseudonocardia TaxID=1847 RepID=F4CIU7_PSEUX|nr:MFS transporter [Pseudonocardia dioxanivorans]AEA22926.1 General substrate transporter [Pseudonocardia dioxanivorans CB1190]GJF05028.1 MFS transporter [Pseudonocardia sp. D17]
MTTPATTATREEVWAESRSRLIPATVIGSLIEWYDIAIYGQAAALVFGTLFFPEFSSTAGRVAAFATFGVGYFARPLGAAIFGHLGDRYGRRVSLVGTLLLMGISTVIIGCLPTYASIGLAAPILLVVCRLLQGAGVGAEYVGAVTMVAEFAPPKRRGYYASLPACGVFLGIGLAAAVSAAVATLPKDQLMTWGWRIPFLLSILVVGTGLFLRLRVPESPVFADLKSARARTKVPALTLIRAMGGRLLLVMVANTVLAFNIYVIQTFALGYLADRDVAKSTTLIALLLGCAVGAVAIPLVGKLSDRVGRKPVYLVVAVLCALTAFPFFWLIDTGNTVLIMIGFALAFGSILAMFGSQAAYYAELFPAAYRFSGFGLGREIPGAVLAGPAPVIAVGLLAAAGGVPWLIAGAMALLAIATIAALAALPETAGIDLTPIHEADDEAAHV